MMHTEDLRGQVILVDGTTGTDIQVKYKKIGGDFLEGSNSEVEFKCDQCLIQKRNKTKVDSSWSAIS